MPSTWNALIQERTEIEAEAEGILTQAQEAERDLEDDERTRFDEITARLDVLNGDLAREQRLRELQRAAPAVHDAGSPPTDDADPDADQRSHIPAPFATLGEHLVAIAAAERSGIDPDPRLVEIQAAATGLGVAAPADGGFLLQTQHTDVLMARVNEVAVLAPLCHRIPVGQGFDGIEAPFIDETSRKDGSRWGGVQVFRAAEAATVTAKKPKFGRMEMRLEEMVGIGYATDRLLKNGPAIEAILGQAFTEEFAFKIDDEIVRGTGAGGEFLGILKAAATVEVPKETSQEAKTVVTDNILNMMARMPARKRVGARWFYNGEIEPQLAKLTLDVGTAGVPMFMFSIKDDPFDGRLMGKPAMAIEQCSALGTVGDLILANLGEYALIEQGGVEAASSIHVKFLERERTFRWIVMNNGQPKWQKPLEPFKGADKLSPFVTLETRA